MVVSQQLTDVLVVKLLLLYLNFLSLSYSCKMSYNFSYFHYAVNLCSSYSHSFHPQLSTLSPSSSLTCYEILFG